MVDVGDDAPDFTAPVAVGDGDIEQFTLSERLDEAPIVLAFFPGAFTSVCTQEMCSFRDRMSAFEDIEATVYGLSTDSPFALNAFREEHDLPFGIISDDDKEIIHQFDAAMDFEAVGVSNVAKRAVFIIDDGGEITYAWVVDNAGLEPDYEEIQDAAKAAA